MKSEEIKPEEVFDIVLDRVRECQAIANRITAIRADACAKDGPPRVGNGPAEYVADFELAGKHVLAKWPIRIEVFKLYYVTGVDYRDAITQLKIKPGTFDWYCSQIKQSVGLELVRRALFSPRQLMNQEATE